VVLGEYLTSAATIDAGAGVVVESRSSTREGTQLELGLSIRKDAEPGSRTLTIENPDCAIASRPEAFTIGPVKRAARKRR
jgi:hypothetical protein